MKLHRGEVTYRRYVQSDDHPYFCHLLGELSASRLEEVLTTLRSDPGQFGSRKQYCLWVLAVRYYIFRELVWSKLVRWL